MRVLVVDDSAVVRRSLERILGEDPEIGRVDTAASGAIALRKLERFDPDLVTLDLEMPGLDGLATLRQLMQRAPRPVILLSAHSAAGAARTLEALEEGALDFVQKPGGLTSESIAQVAPVLVAKVKALARRRRAAPTVARGKVARLAMPRSGQVDVVAIGASTGGTEALRAILGGLPADFPAGLVLVQHMPAGFTAAFARRLDELSALEVKEAAHRDLVRPGRALLAPGHSHMVVRREDGVGFVELDRRPAVGGHRPSVDVLFESTLEAYGARTLGVLLTGMGRDGARGLCAIRQAGGTTLAQDEASSVVFGMPKAAIQAGGAVHVLGLGDIAPALRRLVPSAR
ncbi:MAG: chemotaxis response regulator protein-glutamate methylesterase [Polyangiaceae bacterium]|nr:chemotaxis response regulator protein-glutamate methylesterase [Polyangiaceae bacterium]